MVSKSAQLIWPAEIIHTAESYQKRQLHNSKFLVRYSILKKSIVLCLSKF